METRTLPLLVVCIGVAMTVAYIVGYRDAERTLTPMACEGGTTIVHPTRWPRKGDPMCAACMPSTLNDTIPDSVKVRR